MQLLSNCSFSLFQAKVTIGNIFCFVEICGSVTERHVDISSVTMKMEEAAGCLETSVLHHYTTHHKHPEVRHVRKITYIYIVLLYIIHSKSLYIYRVSQEERAKFWESVPYVKL